MPKSQSEIMDFITENDVKFVRMSFPDLRGNMKNVAVISDRMPDVMHHGLPVETAVFDSRSKDICILKPCLSTMSQLPWRPRSGSVIRFFCDIFDSKGNPLDYDMRRQLGKVSKKFKDMGYSCEIGTKCEFYLFENDEKGQPTKIPADRGGLFDVSPADSGEDIRREICLTLEEMGISPYSSSHKRAPGQNEIDFKVSDPVKACDNMMQYKSVVKAIAAQSGYYASFMPKPLKDYEGSAFSIVFRIKKNNKDIFGGSEDEIGKEGRAFINGILSKISEITAFLNPITNSYKRIGKSLAPKNNDFAINSTNGCVILQRIPGRSPELIVKSPDPACNPYVAVLTLLEAGIYGIENNIQEDIKKSELPQSLTSAVGSAKKSEFVKSVLPQVYLENSFEHFNKLIKDFSSAESVEKFEEDKFFYTI